MAVDNDIELYEFECIEKAIIIKLDNAYAIALNMLSIKKLYILEQNTFNGTSNL